LKKLQLPAKKQKWKEERKEVAKKERPFFFQPQKEKKTNIK